LRQQVLAAFHQVDVDLAVRAGLVPNLVSIVKATAAHESGLLTALAGIRSGRDPHAAAAAEGEAIATSRAVLVLHERYPELRANDLYLDLHDRLWAVEEKLAHTRSLYNTIVKEWNDRTASFPSLLVARCCGYRPAPPFAGDDASMPPRLRNRDAPVAN
jgi:LemA protein